MISIKKLIDDLDYWEFIGIDSDIVDMRNQRPEYKPFVEQAEAFKLEGKQITYHVLESLKAELTKPWYSRYKLYLLKLTVIKLLRKIKL